MPKHAIIIDDNVILAEYLKKDIPWEALNIRIAHVFYDALQVMEVLEKEPVDMIISDIRMPGISGLEMSKQVLSLYPSVKIILISAYEDFQYVQEAIRLGAFDYIEKPINEEYFVKIIEKACLQIDLEKKIQKQLHASKPAMKEKFFHDLLRHSPKEALYHYKDYPEFLDIHTDSSFHLCICIKLNNAGQKKKQFGLEKYYLELLSIENALKETFSDFPLCFITHDENHLILILGKTASAEKVFMNFLQQKLIEMIRYLDFFSFTAGIGNPVLSFWDLSQSFENAKLALEYRFFLPEEAIIYYQDIPNETFLPDMKLESKSKIMIDYICKNRKKELKLFLDQLYEEYLDLHINKNSLFFSIFDITGKILSFLYKMGVEAESLDENLLKNCGNPTHFSTGRDLFDWLYAICIMACDQLDQSISHYQKHLVSMVDHYIQEHYSETDLGLNELAAHTNVSPTHLSATYKKITSQNIIDVISKTRISSAKELLENTSFSIKEVSERTGFSNQYYFSSSFKKITGMSPSIYRSQFTDIK